MSDPILDDPRAFHAQFDLAMIVACARNGVIGRDGDLPWHLPEDLRHFMRSTKGCPLVMGRKTYESLPKPLGGRLSIVVSRSMGAVDHPEVVVVGGLEEAIEVARASVASGERAGPVWICGGETLYRQFLGRVDLVVRTLVEAEPDGDARFPDLGDEKWVCRAIHSFGEDERHAMGFRIEWWVRTSG